MDSKNKKPQVSDLSALLKGLNEASVEFMSLVLKPLLH